MEDKKIYCLKCKKHTENSESPVVKEINTRPSLTAKCKECGTSKHVFVKKSSPPPEEKKGE